MGLIDSLRTVFDSVGPDSSSTASGLPADGSSGAYWCDDCSVRIRDVDLDESEAATETEQPCCPDCGEEMRFERSSGRDCAC